MSSATGLMWARINQELIMNFRITGLSPLEFQPYFGLPGAELEGLGIKRYVVDKKPGFLDRVEMVDAEVGETAVSYTHLTLPTKA